LPAKEYSYLLSPTNFHPLPTSTVPPPFLSSAHQPPSNTPIHNLLAHGHFRQAAVSAALALSTATNAEDEERVFALWYVRLACLTLCGQHGLAAQESKCLGDLSSSFYRHPVSGAHVVSWELRVLAVRLQALGFGEWRRGVMGYYELAKEARQGVEEGDEQDVRMWEARLRELGVRIADTMVEMGDFELAGEHLRSLRTTRSPASQHEDDERLKLMEALVWLRVGDLSSARRCLSSIPTPDAESESKATGVLQALLKTAEGDFTAATDAWNALHESYEDDALITQNFAVCLIYTGQMQEARRVLAELHDNEDEKPFQALTFNLATLYELCTERNREKKLSMAAKDADRAPREDGWEGVNVDYKL
ncbi:hypothetical protein NA57DRAFT_41855, partial [Rhizodiscina lignyota]